jgi:hypothetical protein
MDYKQYSIYQLYVYKNDENKAVTSFSKSSGNNTTLLGM